MNVIRRFQISGLFLILLIAFQNCSPFSFSQFLASSGASVEKAHGGNGEPYDGKPMYTHLVPGLTCSDNRAAVGRMQIDGTEAYVNSVTNACENNATVVPVSALEFSTFSDKYIGYAGSVYTLTPDEQEAISKGIFTEAWCRAWNSDKTASLYEMGVEWREVGKTAQFTFLKEKSAADNSVLSTRTLDADRVTYAQGDGSRLQINLQQKIPGTQKVAGTYSGNFGGKVSSIPVECLMGGQFDPVAPQFTFPGTTNKTLAVGESVRGLTPTVNKEVAQFQLAGDLPKGLNFDAKTGAITGAAEMQKERQSYPVTAIFPFGEITRIVSIGVGIVQVVDQPTVQIRPGTCLNSDRDCDLASALDLGRRIAPLPLIIHVKAKGIELSGAELSIQGDVTIIGMGAEPAKIDAKSLSRHFNVGAGAFFGIQNVVLANGAADPGGSIKADGATIVIENSRLESNRSGSANAGGHGGAIYARQTLLDVRNSAFANNQAFLNGSLIGGGAIFVESAVGTFVKDSSFLGNSAQQGGAIYSGGMGNPLFEISNSKFESNSSMTGGAIFSALSEISVSQSQFSQNHSIFDGGAIAFMMVTRAWVLGSTFEANSGGGFGSAAIFWQGRIGAQEPSESSVLYVLESKFTRHASRTPGAGVILNQNGEVVLRGAQLLQNSPVQNCKNVFDASVTKFSSLGGNTSDDGSCPQ